MARISQDQAQERHAFLLELFRTQPDISRNEAMDTYKDKFGASLNAKTFNELRERAQSEAGEADEPTPAEREDEPRAERESETPVEDAPARLAMVSPPEQTATGTQQPAKKPKVKGVGSRNVFVDASPEQLQFLERVVQQLQEAGANNLRIDHATDRWMVLTVDTK